jgi:hypothetical protein
MPDRIGLYPSLSGRIAIPTPGEVRELRPSGPEPMILPSLYLGSGEIPSVRVKFINNRAYNCVLQCRSTGSSQWFTANDLYGPSTIDGAPGIDFLPHYYGGFVVNAGTEMTVDFTTYMGRNGLVFATAPTVANISARWRHVDPQSNVVVAVDTLLPIPIILTADASSPTPTISPFIYYEVNL